MWHKAHHALTPIHVEVAAALAALECVLAHGVVNRHGEQFTAVRALHFRGASDGSREAEFVVDEVFATDSPPQESGLARGS